MAPLSEPFEEPQNPVPEPLPLDNLLPSAVSVLASTSRGSTGSAADDVVLLARSGEEGIAILEQLLELASEKNMTESLAHVFVHAGRSKNNVEKVLDSFIEISINNLATAGQWLGFNSCKSKGLVPRKSRA